MARKLKRIPTDGAGGSFGDNPFSGLSTEGLPVGVSGSLSEVTVPVAAKKKRVVKMRREKAGRGGKEVTLLKDFENISAPEILDLLASLKKRLGTGGKMQGRVVEIQGDQRDAVEAFLVGKDFRVVRAGG
jgi:predicted translation initiation factor SUI1